MSTLENLYQAIKEHSGMDDDRIVEAGQYGADAGWPGFCYYNECVDFYNKAEELIWDLAREEADALGYKNPVEMFSNFVRADMLGDPTTFKNLLAWFALEEVGHWLDYGRD